MNTSPEFKVQESNQLWKSLKQRALLQPFISPGDGTTCTELCARFICPGSLNIPWKPIPSTEKLGGTFHWCCLAKLIAGMGSSSTKGLHCQHNLLTVIGLKQSLRAPPGPLFLGSAAGNASAAPAPDHGNNLSPLLRGQASFSQEENLLWHFVSSPQPRISPQAWEPK